VKKFNLVGLAVGLILAGLSVLLPATASADVTERCSGPVAVGSGSTYRTCIYATVSTVRARTFLVTTACDDPRGCAVPGNQRLYVELYVNGQRVAADGIDVTLRSGLTYEVAVYYPNAPDNQRYWSQGRVTANPTSTKSPDIIV
jgi:hypothetical protein